MQSLRLCSWRHWIHALHLQRRSACMGCASSPWEACNTNCWLPFRLVMDDWYAFVLHQCSGCLGGYVRPTPAALPEKVNRTFKRRSIRRARGQPARSSQGSWMSSSHENDDNHSVLNSQALRKFSRSLNDIQGSSSASYNYDKSSFENHGTDLHPFLSVILISTALICKENFPTDAVTKFVLDTCGFLLYW